MSRVHIWRAPRVSYCAQGRIWVLREQAECYTVNISESGMLLVPSIQCAPGTNVRIDLPFPGFSRPMPIPAVVVRETEFEGEYAVGVKFESMLAGSLEVLRSFIQSELASMRSSDQLQALQDPLGPEAALVPSAVATQETAEQAVAPAPAPAQPEPKPRPVIDLGELDADLSVAQPETDEVPRHPDTATTEVPLDDGLDELGQRRPKTEVRRVKRRALERLRRKAAVAQPEPTDEAPRPAASGRLPDYSALDRPVTRELKDIPEWVDGPRQIYDEEERELIRESEQDERLKHLYRAAVADVESEKDRDKPKKKKKWF